MEPPLQIVKGDDGVLRDVYDRPMIVVFNALKTGLDDIKKSGRSPPAISSPKRSPFAFVHVDGSTKEDRTARALIRTHVMQDHFRRKREKATQERRTCRHTAEYPKESIEVSAFKADGLSGTCSLPPQPTGNLDPFAQYPIVMTPRTHQLVHHYVNIISGLAQRGAFNYMSSLAVGMRDQALFHVLLLTSALHLRYLTGNLNIDKTEKDSSTEVISHKLTAIRKVNEKLRDPPTAISDEMIHAVTFMAMAESVDFLGGNEAAANAHLDGLSRMIKVRGGLETLDHDIVQKICLADYLCCVEPDLQPRFKLPTSNEDTHQKEHLLRRARLPWPHMQRIEYPSLAEVPAGFQNLHTLVILEDEFIDIVRHVENFCIIFREVHRSGKIQTLRATDFDVTPLRYRLLCMESARRSATQQELVGDACRIGALVFLKTVFDLFGWWGTSHIVRGRQHTTVLEKLKVYLTRLDYSVDAQKTEFLELSLWLTCMAGLLSLQYINKLWFDARLEAIVTKLGLESWEEMEAVLRKFLWIQWIHGLACKEFWEGVHKDGEHAMRAVSPR
ncbi:hypothetical protein N431DRAFT_338467 [Stipitochalara longipes BDJ]|nr:hypothetical protein N431DRAFT_338467 [Stipitochalara longipes BDJ]